MVEKRRSVRDATTRFVLTILTALLLALQFFGPTTLSASASMHSDRVSAVASPVAPEYATCGTPDHDADPNGLPRVRDRHRTGADCAPEAFVRSLLTHTLTAEHAPTGPCDAHRASGSSAFPSPEVLQVFRC
jgi:hypothetical protein